MREDADYRRALERLRWPEGPVCPRCYARDTITDVSDSARGSGFFFCRSCNRPFSVTAVTPLSSTKLPARAWVQAAHMLTANKPATVEEIARSLDVTYATARHMVQRLLGCVEGHRGPLPIFGAAIKASIANLRPAERRRLAAWGPRQARKRAESKAPRVPVAKGALAKLKLVPASTKAHRERTEHFLSWVMATPL